MAALLFHDLSLLSSSAAGDEENSTSRLLLSARALELGYAAVALDHPHRGVLANSHTCRTQPFAPLSSLPLPNSAAFHRRRLASPVSEPFRQYTRITLSIDSPAAAASAVAPSAARLLRTYDIVAARPLSQAAFDHLCQVPYSQQLDLVSIDFTRKLPFRIKLPMLKLALQRGLHFEIAYSAFIATEEDKYTNLADAKLLVEWTKGKNLIISSAAHTATQIRGPYDVINLCSYLLGLSFCRAKAAISTNPRSLILMALRKKHFYKETIRIERLLPHEKLDSTKFVLGDWIGWDSGSCKEDLHSSETSQVDPSSIKDQRPNSPIYGVIQVSHDNPDVPVIAKQPEQPSNDEEIQDETIQADILMDHDLSIFPTSFDRQDAGPCKSGNKDVMEHFAQAASGPFVDLKSADKHVEFDQDAMEVDAIESCKLNLIVGNDVSSTSDTSIKLVNYTHDQGLGHSVTSLEDKSLGKTTESLDDARSYAQYHTDCIFDEREKTPLVHEIASISDVYFADRDVDQSTDIPVHTEAYIGTSKPVECPPGGKDEEESIDQSIDEETEQTAEGEVESVEPLTKYQEVSSTGYAYRKRSADTNGDNDELKEQSSEETIASMQKNIAVTHEQSLNYAYPSSKVEIPTIKSEKRRRKLRSHHSAYLPFLGFLKSAHFKRKIAE